MATFEYVDIPNDAIRLKSATQSIEPATKIFTSLPETCSWRVQNTTTTAQTNVTSPAKSALSIIPQILLSSSLPSSGTIPMSLTTPSILSSAIMTPNPRAPAQSLLSTRDSLSLPIITTNFRRFVSKVGPVFWLQDRVEEIILWKKGWKRTTMWLAVYGFFCYFPRMVLLIPHIVLLGVMLSCYPDPGAPTVPINVAEGSADWQGNIQAIQNLMGALVDVHDAIVPLLPSLVPPPSTRNPPPPPSPVKLSPRFSVASLTSPTPASNPSQDPTTLRQSSPKPQSPSSTTEQYTQPHHPLLIATLLSFLLLLPILMADILPLRLLFFLAGAGGVGCLHPLVRDHLSAAIVRAFSGTGFALQLSVTIPTIPDISRPKLFHALRSLTPFRSHQNTAQTLRPSHQPSRTLTITLSPRDAWTFFRRLVDDDRLADSVWRAPRVEVELWENERWCADGDRKRRKSVVMFGRGEHEEEDSMDDGASTTSSATTATTTMTPTSDGKSGERSERGVWSKTNLRPNERVGWTRGRDGWCGVGGEVSSNLTFSLSPGWAFVETEGWRPDLHAGWAIEGGAGSASAATVGADQDGWTYTTDTWTQPRAEGRPGEGWVTRRRRWVRRVYWRSEDGEP